METENVISQDFQTIQQQIETLLVFLERPVVLRQLIAISLVIALSVLLGWLFDVLLERTVGKRKETNSFLEDKVLPAIGMEFFPVIGLVMIYGVQQFFINNEYTDGLVTRSVQLFWILLVYYIGIFILYITLGKRIMRPYQRRVIVPLLVVVITVVIVRNLLDIQLLSGIQIIDRTGISITVGSVVLSVLIGYAFITASWLSRQLLQNLVFPRFGASEAVATSAVTLLQYAFLLLGVIVTLAVLGLNLTTLSFIAGGLSVGIGLGLQQIVSNFFSGIVMLFEQTLRPGDWVEIDGNLGIVQQIGIRSTTVRTFDNVDRVVPNESILSSTIANYTTASNFVVRQDIDVGVSYDASPKQVMDILMKAAKYHELVLMEPEPLVFFRNFGDSSLDFRLMYFVSHPRYLLSTKSDIMKAIFDAFEKNDIEIPYPQRDLNLRRGWEVLNGTEQEMMQEPVDEVAN